MGSGKKSTSPISATELMAQLEKDEEFQRKRKIREEALSARAAELTAAEQPIVRDLRASGVAVDSVWDLVATATPYPDALPVLLQHLEVGGYPDRVMESLGRALAVKPSIIFWSRLEKLYLSSRGAGEREGAAIALAAAAGPEQVDDLMRFLRNPVLGATRIYFVSPLLRIGEEAGREFIESVADDPVLGKEASLRLSRKRR